VVFADSAQNGSVGFDDFAMLARSFGSTSMMPVTTDYNADGSIGFGDFAILARNFGSDLSAFEPISTGSPVVAALLVDQFFADDDESDDEDELDFII
jgi:hypothetical protein